MRQQVERDGEHMWLRQSVTFSVDGQSRTLEIGIPLRTGATADEIEALLAEADAGMERIGRHLDARVAQMSGGAPSSRPAVDTSGVPALAHSTPPAVSESTEPREPPTPAREVATSSARTSAATSEPAAPAAPTPSPSRTIAERAAPTPAAPATPAPAPARPAAPAAASAPERTPAPPAAAARVTTPPASPGTPMALPEFIAAVQAEQGLNPKQAMERLGVKSLAGLNLREALEMLRSQALRDSAGPMPERDAEPAAARAPVPEPAATAPSAPPRYFEEEDDEDDIIFTEEDGELDAEAEAAGYGAEPLDEDDEDEELDEVPDFGSPPAAPEPPAATAPAAPPSAKAGATSAPKEAAPDTSRAARILAHMRGVRGGGVASAHQRTAFKNIVVAELGEPKAKALIAGIWRITPDKLGPEQLDSLNNWGKRDTFAEDTELVLAAVKAEREREHEHGEKETVGEADAAPERGSQRTTSARATSSRRASRTSPSGGA